MVNKLFRNLLQIHSTEIQISNCTDDDVKRNKYVINKYMVIVVTQFILTN